MLFFRIFFLISLVVIGDVDAHSNEIHRVKQSPYNDLHVTTVSTDGQVKVWDTSDWSLYINYDTIATGSLDRSIQIWSISTGTSQMTLRTDQAVVGLKKVINGFYLAAGLDNGDIAIFHINTGILIMTLQGHRSRIQDLVLINNSTLASSSSDTTIRIWDLTTFKQTIVLNGHLDIVVSLKQLSSDILASGSFDKTIKLWNTIFGSLIITFSQIPVACYQYNNSSKRDISILLAFFFAFFKTVCF